RLSRRGILVDGQPSLAADLYGSGLDALANLVLRDPFGVDHDIEGVLGDRNRRQQDRVHFDLLRAVAELDRTLDLVERRAAGELDRCFAGALAERPRILPHRHGLSAEGDAVERRLVAVLARHGDLAGKALR